MIGFIYIWFDKKHKRYYVGSHMGTEDDGYVCSSSWMKQAYKLRPQDFKRRVIERSNTRQELYEAEHRWLQMMKPEQLGKKYYNLNNWVLGHWASDEKKAREVGQRISDGHKNGRSNRGKVRSEENRAKISESLRGQIQSDETKLKRSESMKKSWETRTRKMPEGHGEKVSAALKGRKLSPEHIAARSASVTGQKRSAETRAKMSVAAKKRVERQRSMNA